MKHGVESMNWYPKMYIGPRAGKKTDLLKKLQSGMRPPLVYFLTLPENPDNLLDIVECRSAFAYPHLSVFGVAYGKQEAYGLAAEIVKEVYEQTGSFQLSAYLQFDTQRKEENDSACYI